MSADEKRKLKRLVALLRKTSNLADDMEITLGNGAEVGAMVGGCADELELRLSEATR